MAAAKAEGEKMWHMPLDDEYKDLSEERFRRLAEYRRALGRRHHGGLFPEGVRRRHAVGPSGYRGHGLAGRG